MYSKMIGSYRSGIELKDEYDNAVASLSECSDDDIETMEKSIEGFDENGLKRYMVYVNDMRWYFYDHTLACKCYKIAQTIAKSIDEIECDFQEQAKQKKEEEE